MAAINASSIQIKDFDLLDIQTKKTLYQEANEREDVALVRQWNDLGMRPEISHFSGPSPISPFMDIATKNDRLIGYLKKLAQTNKLQKDRTFLLSPLYTANKWVKKGNFSRMPGAEYLMQDLEELGITRIKVPLKVAIIKNRTSLLKMTGHESPDGQSYYIDSSQIAVYAKRIQGVDRKFTREEIDQFILIVVVKRWTDLHPENIILAEDGIYLIDTESKSFDGTLNLENLERFESLISEEDLPYFREKTREEINKAKMIKNVSAISGHYQSLIAISRICADLPENEREELNGRISHLKYVGMEKVGYSFLNPNHFSFDLTDIFPQKLQAALPKEEEKID